MHKIWQIIQSLNEWCWKSHSKIINNQQNPKLINQPTIKVLVLEMPLLHLSSSWKNQSPSKSLLSRNFTTRSKNNRKCHSSQADSKFKAQKAILVSSLHKNQAKPLIKMLFRCPEYYVRQEILERYKQSVTHIKFPVSLSTSFEVNLHRKMSLFINT